MAAEVATLLNLLRDIRDALRYLRQDVREALHGPPPRGAPDGDELLTVEQVAAVLHAAGHPADREGLDPVWFFTREPTRERQEAWPQVSRSQVGPGGVRGGLAI